MHFCIQTDDDISLGSGIINKSPPNCNLMSYPWAGRTTWVLCCAKLLQSCPALCDPMDCSLPGSSVHGVLQARILEWVAMPSSRGSSRPRDGTRISYVSLIGRQDLPLAPPGKTLSQSGFQVAVSEGLASAVHVWLKPVGLIWWWIDCYLCLLFLFLFF